MKPRVPFAPSFGDFGRLLTGERGIPDSSLRRTMIKDERLLSVPVEGGKNALRSDEPVLSDHGRWRDVHLGAWNAAYGKTPYFPHLFPQLEALYRDDTLRTLPEFNSALLQLAEAWLEADILLPELEALEKGNPRRYGEVIKDFETKVNYDYSIFDALFRLGKDTVFALRSVVCCTVRSKSIV